MPNNKHSLRTKPDAFLFLVGALLSLLLLLSLWSFSAGPKPILRPSNCDVNRIDNGQVEPRRDSPATTFFDSPATSYTIDSPLKNWDEKRRDWLRKNPSFASDKERVLMITGSQPDACRNPIGDHLLLRFFKNKVDYCRIHGHEVFYNNALLHPKMGSYWAKLSAIRAGMVAHPEAEWIWWVDSDAAFTDMDFSPPLDRYRDHNLVVHGWAHLIKEKRSWTGLNAGVFLIRNSQWALDFMALWARMGPQSPEYEKWGKRQRSTFPDKAFPESDDQTALAYLIYAGEKKWTDRIYLESEYYFEGYWEEIVASYGNISAGYLEMERRDGRLRRRHVEGEWEVYGEIREEQFGGVGFGVGGPRRPFVTHFTGCQPCSGDHNRMYSRESCWDGMRRALNFADDQVLRRFGFVHSGPLDSSVVTVPFDYPVASL